MKDLESRTFESIGELVKYLRVAFLKQKRATLAKNLGFEKGSAGYLKRIEEGTRSASANVLERMVKYCQLESEYIIKKDYDWNRRRFEEEQHLRHKNL